MIDSVARLLRDGVAEGEQAPAVLVRDSLETVGGSPIFRHLVNGLCENVVGGHSQAKGVVLVALCYSPAVYMSSLLQLKGTGAASVSWFQLLDCYTDPLGWGTMVSSGGSQVGEIEIPSVTEKTGPCSCVSQAICSLDSLLTSIIQLGQVSLKFKDKGRFFVGFDSISVLLRYHSLQAVMHFLDTLRSHEQVSAILCLIHSDLHETRYIAAFVYFASSVVHVEPLICLPVDKDAQVEPWQVNLSEGRVRVRQKRRNGRVREHMEEFSVGSFGVRFYSVERNPVNVSNKSSTPKVQFNIGLTEKEREDRSKVILPFEHQGNGKELNIYDGRQSVVPAVQALTVDGQGRGSAVSSSKASGEIHYLRDSDNECPDSDEDPDDDLDI